MTLSSFDKHRWRDLITLPYFMHGRYGINSKHRTVGDTTAHSLGPEQPNASLVCQTIIGPPLKTHQITSVIVAVSGCIQCTVCSVPY